MEPFIPPGVSVTINQSCFQITKMTASRIKRTPIDDFFISLAHEKGELAAGVILSGTGSDGTIGLRAIKEHGGLTLAQESAEYDGMMRSAVQSGLVDVILPAEEMPGKLVDYFTHVHRPLKEKEYVASVTSPTSFPALQRCWVTAPAMISVATRKIPSSGAFSVACKSCKLTVPRPFMIGFARSRSRSIYCSRICSLV
jgi:hypothetical protein